MTCDTCILILHLAYNRQGIGYIHCGFLVQNASNHNGNGHWEPLFMPGVTLNALDSFYHIGPQNNPSESMVIIIPILYMRKLKALT